MQLKELWNYREMLGSLVKKDLKTRYKGSVLGFLWTFLNPLLQLLVYSLLFSVIMRANIDNYAMFLFVALVPWLFFSTSLVSGASCIMGAQGLIEKIYFPRIIIPISVVCSNFMNMIFSFIIVFLALFFTGVGVSAVVIVLPVIMIIEFFFAVGLTLIVSAVNVYFRDLEYILGILTQVWMYLTPILYSVDMVPQQLKGVLDFNPMSSVILAYRDILFYQRMPDMSTLLSAVLCAVGSMVIGVFIFNKLQRRFAEEL